MLHIPFWKIDVNKETDRNLLEEEMKIACDYASKCVGLFISIGETLQSEEFSKKFDYFLKFVRKELAVLPNRVHRSHALLLAVTSEVNIIIILSLYYY